MTDPKDLGEPTESDRLTADDPVIMSEEASSETEKPKEQIENGKPVAPAEKKLRVLPAISLRVWTSQKRLEDIAGFRRHAELAKLGPRTVPEWEQAFKDFMKAPVR